MGFFNIVTAPAVKFERVGDGVVGTVVKPYTEQPATEIGTDKPKLNKRGEPVTMAVIELQTDERDGADDDGIRCLYVDKFALKKAIAEAIEKVGSPDIEVGGRLSVYYTSDRPAQTAGFNPQKQFTAQYVKPSGSFFKNGNDNGEHPEPNALVDSARAAQQSALATYSQGTQSPVTGQIPGGVIGVTTNAPAPVVQAQRPAAEVPGVHNPAADMAKIRELQGYGLGAPMIQAALPHLSLSAIEAILKIPVV